MNWRDRENGIVLAVALTLFTVWMAGIGFAAERETSTDRPGLNYRDFALTIPLPDQCQKACNEERKCRAWTFAWPGKKGPQAHCFLKSGLPPKKSDNCCISGIKTEQTGSDEVKPVQPAPAKPVEPVAEPEPVEVQLEDACREYANTAVEQNTTNNELECELGGSRWGFNFDVYFNWCMKSSSAETRKSNTEARHRDLIDCGAIVATPERDKPEPRDLVRENSCREYASRSVEQAEQAREFQCGYSGPRWATGYQRHFAWCMSVADSYPEGEIETRKSELETCRPTQSLDAGCENYARAAFRLTRQSWERKCGFIGPRWVRNIDEHKSWCVQATPVQREREQVARHRALAACSGGPRVVGACGKFAQAAVRDALRNRERSCGMVGSQWQPDYEEQFIWCMRATPPERYKLANSRRQALFKCGGGQIRSGDEGQFLYRYRWKSTSGQWNSDWTKVGSRPLCEHKGEGCKCGWQNYCSTFRSGEFALWWRDGCDRQPQRMVCEVGKR